MNIVRFKRITIHIFFSLVLLAGFATPVFAITFDLTQQKESDSIPLTEPLALITPKPEKSNTEVMGPEKPENLPTLTPTKQPTPTSAPTNTPAPTLTTAPTIAIAPTQTTVPVQKTAASTQSSGGGLNADILFDMSNNYRIGKGLSPFQKDERICALATARAPEISAEISGGYMHAGKNNHNFPFWFTENIITMRTEAEAFNWWINDHIHRVQIEENNTHSCVACQGNACVQHFTSFRPK